MTERTEHEVMWAAVAVAVVAHEASLLFASLNTDRIKLLALYACIMHGDAVSEA